MEELRVECCAAAKMAAQRHGLALVYFTVDEAHAPNGIASGVLVRLKDEHFVFTVGHNLDPRVLEEHAVQFVSALRGERIALAVLDGIAVDTAEFDAAVIKVAPKSGDDDLSDIALPGARVWPARFDSPQLADGYLTVSGFPKAGFRQTGESNLVLEAQAWMSVRAGCEDSPPCPRPPQPWTVDVWIGADGFASDENILHARQVPLLQGVSGGPYWINADSQREPGLIAIHRQTIGEGEENALSLDADRFARGQLVTVHLRMAAELSTAVEHAIRASHPWILDIDPYVGAHT